MPAAPKDPKKDTIYIDVDDEITAIIDKVESSDSKIVALVLPKRAAVFQSIVNMRLLKRSADEAGKQTVLITTESGVLPIAGAVGVYAAKNLQTKPEIPAGPDVSDMGDQEDEVSLDDSEPQDTKPLEPEDTVDISSEPKDPDKKSAKKPKKNKSTKVPNFEKFRKKLFIIIGAAIALIAFLVFVVFSSGNAKITITTNTESANADVTITADTNKNSVSVKDEVVPATLAEKEFEDSQTAEATGTKDVSTKAKGTVTVENCQTSNASTLPKGSKFTSSNGKTFLSDSAASLTPAGVSGAEVTCGKTNIAVSASAAGDSYNIGATSYTNSSLAGDYNITGSAMSGGESKTIKVVSQQDVDNAKGKMDTGEDEIAAELKSQLEQQGLFAITDSLKATDEKTVVSPKVGQEATEVSVEYSATYTMLGVNRDDLKEILAASIEGEIDPEQQKIQNDGLDQATFTIESAKQNGTAAINISTTVEVGPNINENQLKSEIAGKKKGDTYNTVKSLPGVTDVQIDYSPFWVSKTPSNPDKVTFLYEEAE